MGGLSVFVILGILTSMYLLFIIIISIVIIYLFTNYIFESIFLYTVSKKLNYKFASASWIPFYNKCILGRIANKKAQGIALFIIDIIIIALVIFSCLYKNISSSTSTIIFLTTVILIIISFVLNIRISHNIIKKVTPKLADIITILNVFTIGFLRAIILFW